MFKYTTPYAVTCPIHGKQCLSREQYIEQLDHPDKPWTCPICSAAAEWDDDCPETNPPLTEEEEEAYYDDSADDISIDPYP